MSHVHTNHNNLPNIIDRDEDVWAWTDSDKNGDSGYRIIKRGNGHRIGDPDVVSAYDAEYIRHVWGPIKEVPVTVTVTDTIKLPEVPEDVVALKAGGNTYKREGAYWTLEDSVWDNSNYTLAELLADFEELELVRESELDKAVKYFKDHVSPLDADVLGDRLAYSGASRKHAAVIVDHFLDNHGK